MSTWMIVGFGSLVLGLFYWFGRRSGFSGERLLRQAIRSGDVAPLAVHLEAIARPARPTAYNRAIRALWDGYHRDLAAPLIRALAQNHADSHIAQYWIGQLLAVEPDLANRDLDRAFLDTFYRPEVAARCGPVG